MEELKSTTWRNFPISKIPSSLTLDSEIFLHLRQADRILDLGCGIGNTCTELFKNGFKNIVGVDINELAISSVSKDFSKFNDFKGGFLVGDILNLPFDSGSFDFVILQAVLTIIYTPDERSLILSEVYKILSSRGRLFICDFGQTWESPLYRDRYLMGFKELGYEATFQVIDQEDYIPSYYAHHFSVRELNELLMNVGFNIIVSQYKHFSFRTRSGNLINGVVVVAKR